VNSSGSVEVGAETVRGSIALTGTRGLAAELEQNHVTGALLCTGNAPPPIDGGQPNTAAVKGGQCSAPGF
jgi:hypothetical protein